MIVILDTTKGRSFNFGTRTAAAEFIGVSRPTLRGWLKNPFYLHKTLIITHTSNEKVQQSKRALLKKKVAQFQKDEIQRVQPESGHVRINGSPSPEPSPVAAPEKIQL